MKRESFGTTREKLSFPSRKLLHEYNTNLPKKIKQNYTEHYRYTKQQRCTNRYKNQHKIQRSKRDKGAGPPNTIAGSAWKSCTIATAFRQPHMHHHNERTPRTTPTSSYHMNGVRMRYRRLLEVPAWPNTTSLDLPLSTA